jgi:hypothetical protein
MNGFVCCKIELAIAFTKVIEPCNKDYTFLNCLCSCKQSVVPGIAFLGLTVTNYLTHATGQKEVSFEGTFSFIFKIKMHIGPYQRHLPLQS